MLIKKIALCLFTALFSQIIHADDKVYTVGILGNYLPFSIKDGKGSVTGFNADLINAIAEKEDLKIRFAVTKTFKGMLETLDTGEKDIVVGFIITPERAENYAFSNPYLDSRWGLLLKVDHKNPTKYIDYNQAISSIHQLSSQVGGTGEQHTRAVLEEKGEGTFLPADTQYLAIQKVATGEADVAYLLAKELHYYAKIHPISQKHEFYVLENPNSHKEVFGFAVKKNRDDDLLAKLNEGLEKVKADGTYHTLLKKWFGE
ncbi:substrate-binding periplasmic protein [Suttonella ornithocola]|uniref:ABC transporter arginine-binding protein 2 n=1 Tax=Suttonella ornithocola TaxID=279832 RepID=A0A380MPV9_9GAMM|nr:transporter substrate-binding domain-containing protein [Suttonella ornithocola]SUO93933.1 Putative ABC transporter arginine-binding protein 2 precursor [Suttonella ornithocola]